MAEIYSENCSGANSFNSELDLEFLLSMTSRVRQLLALCL
jgi:hypothetical protein